jgi:hypothetical protein
MSEQLTPRQAQNEAKHMYKAFKEHIDASEETKNRLAAVVQQEISKGQTAVESGELRTPHDFKPSNFYTGSELGRLAHHSAVLDIRGLVHDERDKRHVAENLDAYRTAALADAVLDGVHISLQQPEDRGEQVEVHIKQ